MIPSESVQHFNRINRFWQTQEHSKSLALVLNYIKSQGEQSHFDFIAHRYGIPFSVILNKDPFFINPGGQR